ncbi:MAG: molybdopterin-binding protein [Thermotaleaceae bacterium]
MKTVSVYDAAGTVLVHDMTQIIPGEFKESRFKKGYIIREEDIPVLLSMGKEKIFVIEKDDKDVHENEAAIRISTAAAGKGITLKSPKEGKVELCAAYDGLLKIDREILDQLIEQDEIMFATLHQNQLVKKDQVIGGTRVIPLFVKEEIVSFAEKILSRSIMLDVRPLKPFKVGVVTTGSEVYTGRIKDGFGPVLTKKFDELGSKVVKQVFTKDDEDMIAGAIGQLIYEKADMIAVTGGMSVDPDDRTPSGIRKAGGDIVAYGAPVLPGAMFMLAYIKDIPVIGVPGCVMYHNISIFDLIVPRILAGERPTRRDIKALAHGGLCRNCKACTYPNCAFGKSR